MLMAFWEKEWLSKDDLQSFVDTLTDEAVICPQCITKMKVYSGDERDYYSCPTLWCPNEALIPVEEVRKEVRHGEEPSPLQANP